MGGKAPSLAALLACQSPYSFSGHFSGYGGGASSGHISSPVQREITSSIRYLIGAFVLNFRDQLLNQKKMQVALQPANFSKCFSFFRILNFFFQFSIFNNR